VRQWRPVVIPKLYDGRNRTFFFGYYNLMRWRTETDYGISTVPTPEMLSGDFTSLRDPAGNMRLIYDPLTSRLNAQGEIQRDPFAGNRIPSSRFSKVSQNVASYIPKPNYPSVDNTRNYLGKNATVSDDDRLMAKIDHMLSDRQGSCASFTGRTSCAMDGGVPKDQNYLAGFTTRDEGAVLVRLSHDFTISPTVLNRFSFGYNRDAVFNGTPSVGGNWGNKLGLTGLNDPNGQFPNISMGSDGTSLGGAANAWWAENGFVYSDILSIVRGKHSMRIGGEFRKYQMNVQINHRAHGVFSFGGSMTNNPVSPNRLNTGSGVADFLMGEVNSGLSYFPMGTHQLPHDRAAAFFQDDTRSPAT